MSKPLNRFSVHQIEECLVNNFLYDVTKKPIPHDSRRTEETASVLSYSGEVTRNVDDKRV